jgi:hypothetical protein
VTFETRPSSHLGHDQLHALAVLRYWFGDLEVLAVLERLERLRAAAVATPARPTDAPAVVSLAKGAGR